LFPVATRIAAEATASDSGVEFPALVWGAAILTPNPFQCFILAPSTTLIQTPSNFSLQVAAQLK